MCVRVENTQYKAQGKKPPAAEQVKMLKTYNSCSGSKYNCRKMYTHASILFILLCICVQHNMRWVFVNTKCIIIINESEISPLFSPVNFSAVKIYMNIVPIFMGFYFEIFALVVLFLPLERK